MTERDLMRTRGTSNYEPIVEHDTYRRITQDLVGRVALGASDVVVDLGGGTGAIAETVVNVTPGVTVWVIDPDPDMLADAAKRLGSRIHVAAGGAEDIGTLVGNSSVDVVFMGNCIHLIEDIPAALLAVHSSLVDGGSLAFNTSYLADADEPSERHLYWEMLMSARAILRERGIHRTRHTDRPLAKRRLTRSFYESAVTSARFTIDDIVMERVTIDAKMVLDIVSAPVFAQGALPGVDGRIAASVMRAAAQRVLDRRTVEGIRRMWMTVLASK